MTSVLGLDIGGSTTRGRLAVDGATVGEASAGSASLTAAGREAATQALQAVVDQLRPAMARPPDAVYAGAAGSEVGGGAGWLTETLRGLTGTQQVSVVQDVALLLPAAGHADGIAIVIGTGSIVHGRHGGRTARAGGWGYLLGDEGSAYRLVVEALRVELARRDRGEAPGALRAALTTDGDLDAVVAALHAEPRPRRWAALAPDVLACEDPAVDEILDAGAAALAGHAAAVAARLGLAGGPIVLAGGLTAGARARDAMSDALGGALAGWTVECLEAPPVAGAVALAQRALSQPQGRGVPGGKVDAATGDGQHQDRDRSPRRR